MNKALQKKVAATKAIEYIKDGMIIGLGSGSTSKYMLQALAKKIKNKRLKVTGVATSKATANMAQQLQIPLKHLNQVQSINLNIDGADTINQHFQGIKGGGGSQLREKIIANNAQKNIWIIDESKFHSNFINIKVPIEVEKFGHLQLLNHLKKLGYAVKLRKLANQNKLFVTDNNNYIIDLYLKRLTNPQLLANKLKKLTGVIDTGLFINTVDKIIIGTNNGTKVINIERKTT